MTPEPLSQILTARELMRRAARSDRKALSLPPEIFEMLAQKLCLDTKLSTPQAALPWLQSLGLPAESVPSLTALYELKREFPAFHSMAELTVATRAASAVQADMETSGVPWLEVNAHLLGQRTFEKLSDPTQSTDEKKIWLEALATLERAKNDKAKLSHAERKLKLLEDSAQKAKDELTKVAARGGLTPETQAQIQTALSLL